MILEFKTIGQLEAMIAQARETEQAALAALVVNGRKMFADDEHERRVTAIETQRRQATSAVLAEVQRRSNALDEQLKPAEAEPMQQLSTDEVQRAAALDTFIAQDIQRILERNRPGEVAAFISAARAAARGSDRAAKAVFLRRLPEIRPWLGSDHAAELAAIESELQRPFAHAGDTAALEAQQRDLRRIENGVVTSTYLERTYGARR